MYEDSIVHGQCAWAAWTAYVDGGARCMCGWGDAWFECSAYVCMYVHKCIYRCIFTVTPQIPTTIPPSRDIYTHTIYSHMCVYMHIMHGVCGVHRVHGLSDIYIYIYIYIERERKREG